MGLFGFGSSPNSGLPGTKPEYMKIAENIDTLIEHSGEQNIALDDHQRKEPMQELKKILANPKVTKDYINTNWEKMTLKDGPYASIPAGLLTLQYDIKNLPTIQANLVSFAKQHPLLKIILKRYANDQIAMLNNQITSNPTSNEQQIEQIIDMLKIVLNKTSMKGGRSRITRRVLGRRSTKKRSTRKAH